MSIRGGVARDRIRTRLLFAHSRTFARFHVVAMAREWIGTPYHHQASVKGAGCDCLGLIRGLYTEITGRVPETPMTYPRDWGNAQGKELMLAAAREYLIEQPKRADSPVFGDVMIFRVQSGKIAKHAAICAGLDRMVHAQEGAPVSEVAMGRWWRNRIVAVFSFPGVE